MLTSNAALFVDPSVNPLRVFAVRSLASLDVPDEAMAEMQRHRTALLTVLSAAGVDVARIAKKASASFSEDERHVLVAWYDIGANQLRLFAPPRHLVDETTERAMDLLAGNVIPDLDAVPIEDADACIRLMALLSVGGESPEELHERFVAPREDLYDDDFVAPEVADLAALWGQFMRHYVGGTNAAPFDIEPWLAQTFAFGFSVD